MIIGIGIDLLETHRIQKALESDGFKLKYFTTNEIELSNHTSWRKLANNYVAKEAVAKAFGLGFHKFKLIDIEVLRNPLGKPYVCLHGNARKIARKMRVKKIHISISDIKTHITAMAVIEK